MSRATALIVSSLSLAGVVGAALVLAGPLDPPAGPVVSTYRTLAEVEPRIPISSPMQITAPGSYYLTRDISGGVGNAITVTASRVTVDLNGFSLVGGPGSGKAIVCVGTPDTIVVRNGTIRDWGQRGIEAGSVANSRFENLTFISCGLDGLLCGSNCVVTKCIASDNGEDGIHVGTRTLVSECLAFGNTSAGFRLDGFCTITGCESTSNGTEGIAALGGCRVASSLASRNHSHGILVAGICRVTGNTCISNGFNPGTGAGIHVSGPSGRIEDNHVIGNDFGIQVAGVDNLIVRNSAGTNGDNYAVATGNIVGAVVTESNIAVSGNPHANYEF